MTSARLNLLFLFSDQHSHRVAGCYGDALGPTPNLDRLASEGVTFDNAYCPSPICVPSRMSMLTARYPYAQECWTNDDILRSDYATWLHALGASGYRPELIGRLHALGPDQLHGYAAREVGDHSPNWAGVPRHDLGVLDKANDPWRESLSRSGIGQSAYQVKDAETAAAACRWLEAIAATSGGTPSSPFCVTVGFLLPHPPYVAWNEDFERFAGCVGLPSQTAPQGSEHPWLRWWRESRDIAAVTVDETLRARTAYYGLVHRLDILIGQVLDTLERVGLARNTLVVYATDHGDHIGERGLWWKHTLYEESARVPLIMRAPGALPAGERRSQVVNLIDVAVTMLDMLGAPPLPHAQGRSFLEVARDPRSPWHDETFSEYCTDAIPAWTGGMAVQQRMVRADQWKLIYYHGYPPQLFDLAADPDESVDLASDSRHADVRERLLARVLDGWDPEWVAARMRERRRDKDLLGAWARNIHPDDQYRWDLRPEYNRLDSPLA